MDNKFYILDQILFGKNTWNDDEDTEEEESDEEEENNDDDKSIKIT